MKKNRDRDKWDRQGQGQEGRRLIETRTGTDGMKKDRDRRVEDGQGHGQRQEG
jgi:hypothetical protein